MKTPAPHRCGSFFVAYIKEVQPRPPADALRSGRTHNKRARRGTLAGADPLRQSWLRP